MPVDVPSQIVCDAGVAVTTGFDPIVITTSIGEPIHVAKVGVILYVADPEIELVAFNV
jgi:hypothetical protein